ncbi:hypothetical protein SERLADRAFT_405823 [Serpula lacrymans var. lacrymans S7.9]|uniref:DUF6830 domain-containing protein n=1 Tax=Serpula lacrymans var. lacrymans (strain S7.9) TaxID=578457 RepID=F8NLB9_SERL9|nr:uncharacterized protein SERLADRAFT_405823 [Serpula lacrymans var. lacrymans S7.9]EGO28167.1 hypothetical protein SERLADRAFT_405823 [Serpula lacrymans var. lacrymans S7.9]
MNGQGKQFIVPIAGVRATSRTKVFEVATTQGRYWRRQTFWPFEDRIEWKLPKYLLEMLNQTQLVRVLLKVIDNIIFNSGITQTLNPKPLSFTSAYKLSSLMDYLPSGPTFLTIANINTKNTRQFLKLAYGIVAWTSSPKTSKKLNKKVSEPWDLAVYLPTAKELGLSGVNLPFWFFFDHPLVWCKEVVGKEELDAHYKTGNAPPQFVCAICTMVDFFYQNFEEQVVWQLDVLEKVCLFNLFSILKDSNISLIHKIVLEESAIVAKIDPAVAWLNCVLPDEKKMSGPCSIKNHFLKEIHSQDWLVGFHLNKYPNDTLSIADAAQIFNLEDLHTALADYQHQLSYTARYGRQVSGPSTPLALNHIHCHVQFKYNSSLYAGSKKTVDGVHLEELDVNMFLVKGHVRSTRTAAELLPVYGAQVDCTLYPANLLKVPSYFYINNF